ncbi:CaiB/BaiF CoA transferase family protein [Naumannella cuiyingiana]|uniref:Crotonobetainyl-CoA:carnitine CoA-transferase CaiB-like acyl-CoA transferase n=1 Tax=Naumannella cuiyingiana TaxID=1347891 RepID=A0A7Z0D6H6_9ACTN|nr:CoA transferase [Naumannella cuiyingiana]NYI69805.1 crotonobetainyl-CoA:carnitine CoA-transferase CaiB-like acyl-CoA transferase [Naumannella cuiyingiana]
MTQASTPPAPDAAEQVPGSLSGIRVLDLTGNVAGPFATQVLGDLGADVIKVERPGSGDDTRGWGPPFWGGEEGLTFASLNRNKRSITVDLKSPEGVELLRELIGTADVVVQNLRPGALDRIGLDWPTIRELNPRVVYCAMTGFGPEGPRATDPAYDPLMQAFSGLMSVTGEDGRPPVRIPVSILDKGTGMWAVIGILDALRTRDATGRGARVDVSLLDTALTWEATQLMTYLSEGKLPPRLGSGSPGVAPYGAFAATDGDVVIAAGNQRLWEALCSALDTPQWLELAEYADNAARFANRAALNELLAAEVARYSVSELLARLTAAGVPVNPINTVDLVVDDPQVAALGSIERIDHPRLGDYALIRTPISVDGRRSPTRLLPPQLGEHDDEVRREVRAGAEEGARR